MRARLSLAFCCLTLLLASAAFGQSVKVDLGARTVDGKAPASSDDRFVWIAVDRTTLQEAILDASSAPSNLLSPRLRELLAGRPQGKDKAAIAAGKLWTLASDSESFSAEMMTFEGGALVLRFRSAKEIAGSFTLSFGLKVFLDEAVGSGLSTTGALVHDKPIVFSGQPAENVLIDADLGASMTKVWFKGQSAVGKNAGAGAHMTQGSHQHTSGAEIASIVQATPETPLVGIDIDKVAFKAAAHRYASVPFVELDKKIDDLFAGKLADTEGNPVRVNMLWCVEVTDSKLFKDRMAEMCAFADVQPGDSKLTLILSRSNSINASYKVGFLLGSFLRQTLGVAGKETLVLRHPRPVYWPDRGSLSLTSSISVSSNNLITAARDAMGNYVKNADGTYKYNSDDTSLYKISLRYFGVPNPLQEQVFDEHSYYDLKFDAALSTNPLDSRSSIGLQLAGTTDYRRIYIPSLVTLSGVNLLTSQSMRQTTFYYELGYRLGDKRTNGHDFYADSNVLGPVYGELTLQAGRAWFKRIKDVPDPRDIHAWIARPRLRLGLSKFLEGKGSLVSLSGTVDLYYLDNKLGGGYDPKGINDPTTGLREVFNASVAFGTASRKLTVGVQGGTNPALGFVRISPTFSVGLDVKF